jgi:hypothetical protein
MKRQVKISLVDLNGVINIADRIQEEINDMINMLGAVTIIAVTTTFRGDNSVLVTILYET